MDIYFSHDSITELSLYNCSSLSEEEVLAIRSIRRPLRGLSALLFGVVVMLIYILCLQVMLRPKVICKACYKMMFFIGLYEIITVMIHDIIMAFSMTFGIGFCDMPNIYYFFGCAYAMSWAGASYLCLYLAFNRVIEMLKFSRAVIDFFFSPIPTYIGCSIGFLYSLLFFFRSSPVVYSNTAGTAMPDPLGLAGKIKFEYRSDLMIVNNLGVVVITSLLYSCFCLISSKNIRQLSEVSASHTRLQHQVFIQSTLMCGFNFTVSVGFAIYLVCPHLAFLPQIVFVFYQYSIGLQALVYLFFNQTVRDGVKENVFGALRIKLSTEPTDMRTAKINTKSTSTKSTVHFN